MPLIIRLGDTSTHGGQVVTSASKWQCEGALIARLGDMLACPLHGINPIIESSETWFCEGAGIAREGDKTLCQAELISGQSEWLCD